MSDYNKLQQFESESMACLAPLILTILICNFYLLSRCQATTYNMSLCTDIEIDTLHYYINTNQNSADLSANINGSTVVYNLCSQVEVQCIYLNAILNASMVVIDDKTSNCYQYTQTNITYIDQNNASQGIKVLYMPLNPTAPPITFQYACNGTQNIGCPSVQSGVMWTYFNKQVITYTIVIEIVGIILMVLGVYIYRGSIVLIGWGTFFIILMMIESLFVFLKGVPDSLIQNVLILTLICSFFVGYILGYFPKAGVFCMGLWIGFVIALTLNNIAFYYINSSQPNLVLYIVLPVLSIGFGILILYIRRAFITFASSLIGSYLSLRALSWNLGAFPNQFTLSKSYHLGLIPPVPWQFYLYVVALFILTASSSALQTWLFRKKMKKTKDSDNIEQHLDRMENSLRKQRDGLIEFKNVFQSEGIQPRVLSKPNTSQPRNLNTSIQQQQQRSQTNKQDKHSDDQSLPNYQQSDEDQSPKEDLKKGLLKGANKK